MFLMFLPLPHISPYGRNSRFVHEHYVAFVGIKRQFCGVSSLLPSIHEFWRFNLEAGMFVYKLLYLMSRLSASVQPFDLVI